MSVEYREVPGSTGGVCCQYFKTCLTVTEFYRVPWSFRRYLGILPSVPRGFLPVPKGP